MNMMLQIVRSAGRWLSKDVSEDHALLAGFMVTLYPMVRDEDLDAFKTVMNKNGLNPSDFKWPVNEKAVHPTCEPEKFQQRSAMFAEVLESRHAM